jgi:hypothetical protein
MFVSTLAPGRGRAEFDAWGGLGKRAAACGVARRRNADHVGDSVAECEVDGSPVRIALRVRFDQGKHISQQPSKLCLSSIAACFPRLNAASVAHGPQDELGHQRRLGAGRPSAFPSV